jgi:thioredoxin-dependent peroxiredoxin
MSLLNASAPDFTLPDQDGTPLTLFSLKGQMVVLYAYPKDDTSGCTQEAKDFTERLEAFTAAGARVLGLSPDDSASHHKFRCKYDLSITLLADTTKETLQAYGVWVEKSMYGKKYMGVERTTFLMDKEGVIRHIWSKVKVSGHAEAVLNAVKELV